MPETESALSPDDSRTATIYTLCTALKHAGVYIDSDGTWKPFNKQQECLLTEFFYSLVKEIAEDIPEIKTKVSEDYQLLNLFMKEECGVDIQFQPFNKALKEVGVVSFLDLLVKWLVVGEVTKITTGGKEYPAVRLKEDKHGLLFLKSGNHSEPIVRIMTQGGDHVDQVYMTIADKPLDGFNLIAKASELTNKNNLSSCGNYDKVRFPMVELSYKPDISWLLGMETKDKNMLEWIITQALQQTKLRMNEFGARMQDTVAVAVSLRSCVQPKQELVIDKPFYYWVMRKGLSRPLFTAYVAPDTWKEPRTL